MIVRIHLRNGKHHDVSYDDGFDAICRDYRNALDGYPFSPLLYFPGIVVRAKYITTIEQSAS